MFVLSQRHNYNKRQHTLTPCLKQLQTVVGVLPDQTRALAL